MATGKIIKRAGGSQGASNRTSGYFSAPTITPPAAQATAPAAPAAPIEDTGTSPVVAPNVSPGLSKLGNDSQAPGAGMVQQDYSGPPATLADVSQGASMAGGVMTPAAVMSKDLGMYQAGSGLTTFGKVAGIASDVGAGEYGKAMAGVGSLLPGPVGLAIGVGKMGYDAYQGGWGDGPMPSGSMAAMGARVATSLDENKVRERAAGGGTEIFTDGNKYTEAAPAFIGTPIAETGMDGQLSFSSPQYSADDYSSSGAVTSETSPVYSGSGGGWSSRSESAPASRNEGTGSNAPGGFADGGVVGLSIPGYADGGEMGGGPLLAMGFANGGPMGGAPGHVGMGAETSPQMIEMRVNQMARNPQFQQRVMQMIQPLMQSGELTPQEVTTMGQIAMASMQNPKLYPQLRQFVASQGMTPLPPSYDPTTIMKILSITRALEQSGGGMAQPGQGQETPAGQVPPTSQAQMVNPTGAPDGGMLQGPGTGRSDSIGTQNMSTGGPVKVSNGEYVIPEHVVKAKGRDFFDAMLRRYASVPKDGE